VSPAAARMCRHVGCPQLQPCPAHGARVPFEGAHRHAAVYRDPAYRAAARELRRRFRPGDLCGICHEPMLCLEQLQVDHVDPVAVAGGAGELRLVHGACNLRRGAELGRQRAAAAGGR